MDAQQEPSKRNVGAFYCFLAIGVGFLIIAVLTLTDVITLNPGAPVFAFLGGIVNITVALVFLRPRQRK